MPNPIASLTTARLLAEAITPLHFHDLHRLLSDPLVMKTLSADGKPLSEEVIREQIGQNVGHWQQHGFGLWVFHRKSETMGDGQFIGRAGLKTLATYRALKFARVWIITEAVDDYGIKRPH